MIIAQIQLKCKSYVFLRTHKLLYRLNCESKGEKNERVGVRSLICNILGLRTCARALGWRLGRVTSESIIHTDLHKLNNKLVNA